MLSPVRREHGGGRGAGASGAETQGALERNTPSPAWALSSPRVQALTSPCRPSRVRAGPHEAAQALTTPGLPWCMCIHPRLALVYVYAPTPRLGVCVCTHASPWCMCMHPRLALV